MTWQDVERSKPSACGGMEAGTADSSHHALEGQEGQPGGVVGESHQKGSLVLRLSKPSVT